MRETEVPVAFQPPGRTVYVLYGTRLMEAAARAGVVLESPCGGEGICGKCRLLVTEGAGEPTPAERRAFSEDELRAGLRLACQSAVCGPTSVKVPQTSLRMPRHQILTRTAETSAMAADPAVRKQYVELSPPARGDDDPDLVRLEKALKSSPLPLAEGQGVREPGKQRESAEPYDAKRPHPNPLPEGEGTWVPAIAGQPLTVDLEMLRVLPARLRAAAFRGTAVVCDGRLIDFEPGNTEAENNAVAVDVGTSTLVAALVDLGTGAERAVTARLNPQTRFGDDVLSRIRYAGETPDGLQQLHETVVEAIDEMIGELTAAAEIGRQEVYELSFSGNTTMQQLLCGLDPGPLGRVPFVPAAGRGLEFRAAELGLHVHPRALARVLPVIGGFVGGDTVAGILATGLSDAAGPTLLVDIGTNGEIVLWAQRRLSAASTAAGPAFEGARISQGMRAADGAVEKVVVDGRLRLNVIGNVPPLGLCGSGLIDLAAELLRHGLITPQGRLLGRERLPPGVIPDLAERPTTCDGQPAFLLAAAAETGHGRPILLTQQDIRELQLATGAIRAGIAILLKRAGLKPEDLEGVLVAGGFGNVIRRSNAQRIGLLPREVDRHRIRYVGNTSLAGARLVAVSRDARRLADELAARTEHVDLSFDPAFHATFAESMRFPEA